MAKAGGVPAGMRAGWLAEGAVEVVGGLLVGGVLLYYLGRNLATPAATRLRRGGAGLDTVAAVLGHATLAMAARYAHIGSADLRAAMASLPAPAKPAAAEAVGQVMPFTSETRAG